ncbi:MAG: CHAT domain-containing protein [Flammeovirgaceae bacterium]
MPPKQLPIIFLAFANEREDDHAYLRNLTIEQRELRKALAKLEDEEIAEVEILHGVTIKDIFDFFQHEKRRNRVIIFHYAGHANSFQFLLEAEDGTNQAAHGEGLLSFLTKQENLKLVVLNGCSTKGHVETLVKSSIATVATSNSIDDGVATQFAIRFYEALANKTPLKMAFQEAEDFIFTLKGTANIRDLYWEGATVAQVPHEVPWKLYSPAHWTDYATWTIIDAFAALNLTLAQSARTIWLKAVADGDVDREAIQTELRNLLKVNKRENRAEALKLLAESLPNRDNDFYSYLKALQAELKEIRQQRRRNVISDQDVEKAIDQFCISLIELTKN